MTSRNCFNIRVYGLCIREKKVLVSDEFVMDMYMTKFPGGGLEYGESPPDCLKRECREEMEIEINVTGHFYTTDFFQPTRFYANTQLISIYYTFDLPKNHNLEFSTKKFDFPEVKNGVQSFRWVPLSSLKQEDLTFPVDQKVAGMIIEGNNISKLLGN